MFQTARRFLRHSGGNVAMMMALAGFPLCIAVGAAVDYSRASSAKSAIQAATDAAALAAAKDPNLSEARAKEVVNQYLAANGIDTAVAHVNEVKVEYDKKTGAVSVSVSGQLDTSLMSLAGIQSMDIGGHSEVQAGSNALEVALVLDNTFSMSAQGRLPALKSAANALLDQIYANSSSSSDVKAAIVPFSDYVNVGMSHRNDMWVDVPADFTETITEIQWMSSNCHNEPIDGVAGTSQQICEWAQTGPLITYTIKRFWEGCVGSRSSGHDTSIGTLSDRYVGLLNNDSWDEVVCGQPITPLTNNLATLKSDINKMDVLNNQKGAAWKPEHSPETYIPVGLLWGWNVLDANEPLTGARTASEVVADKATKALILMTDGKNTLAPDYSSHKQYSEAGSPSQGVIANGITSELCSNIKAAGISVYTVSLEVTDPVSLQMLSDCASTPAMAFNASDSTALVQAFSTIARSLVAVHISQ